MPSLNLNTAAIEIQQAVDQNKRQGLQSPFFFMVGAGVSYPPVPLANMIVSECKDEAAKYRADPGEAPKAQMEAYSHWFSKAYPQPESRRLYLRNLIEKAKISQATFRLAHLLLDRTAANLVVTTNFDNLLSRALTLFGVPHISCDDPAALSHVDPHSKDVQIIHVHGSFGFYDCCDLKGEIADRAAAGNLTPFTMASMLDEIFRTRSPLIVGYSGWEGDVFMAALRRRLREPLQTKLYWFCYTEQVAQSLPLWVCDHPNVCIVAPEETNSGPAKITGAVGSLPATSVFDELVRRFGLESPLLTQDPLGFFPQGLRSALGKDRAEAGLNLYGIASAAESVEKSNVPKVNPGELTPAVDSIEPIRNAVRRSEYREAIGLAAAIPLAVMGEEHLRELILAAELAARALSDNSDDELTGYDLVIAIATRLEVMGRADFTTMRSVARASVNKGVTLGELNRSQEEIAVYEDVVGRFGGATEPVLREQVAKALVNKGCALGQLNRSDAEIAAYDDVVQRFGEASEPALREEVAKALVNKGYALGQLNRNQEALAVYDELVRRFAGTTEPVFVKRVARALVNKGVTLGQLNRNEDEIAVYEDVVRRFGEASDAALQEQVAKALVSMGYTLGQLRHGEEAIANYDEVVRRFGMASEATLREWVAKALRNKGYALGRLNRTEEAIAAYDEVIRRFGGAPEQALKEHVARAVALKEDLLRNRDRTEGAQESPNRS